MQDHRLRHFLTLEDEDALRPLFAEADGVRRRRKGDGVWIRGLLEISNRCARHCAYCGLRADNRRVHRYAMTDADILRSVEEIHRFGHQTVVLQAGEHRHLLRGRIGELIAAIKIRYPSMAVTLSLGEQPEAVLSYWRRMGADRYLLKFETSDAELYGRIHPPKGGGALSRIPMLRTLRALGYEVGSGIMVGIPGQTLDSIARDLELFRSLRLDMVAVGPYIPHGDTPLGVQFREGPTVPHQAPNTPRFALKVIALARIVCPDANIPATSALSAVDTEGYQRALEAGANVIMHNLTPVCFKKNYSVYRAASRKQESHVQWDRIERAVTAAKRVIR